MEKEVWESSGKDIQVWINSDSLLGVRLYYANKNSNMSYGITLKEAEAIYNAVAYFKNSGEWPK
jgi:hypothetical protein